MANVLDEGTVRFGALHDGMAGHAPVPTLLEVVQGKVRISAQWPPTGPTAHGTLIRALPGGVTPPLYPANLLFRDGSGAVALIGCTPQHRRRSGAGHEEVMTAKFAVTDSGADPGTYDQVRDLRVAISGLRAWVGVGSVGYGVVPPSEARGRVGFTAVSFSLDPICLPGDSGLSLEATASVDAPGDGSHVTIRNSLFARKTVSERTSWEVMLDGPRAIRDLLTLSSGKAQRITSIEVRPEEKSGWMRVLAARGTAEAVVVAAEERHLITYGDVGVEGLARWIALREECSRALDSAISVFDLGANGGKEALLSAGIAAEALGLHVATLQGYKKPDDMRFAERLRLIGEPLAETIGLDVGIWAANTAKAYNGLKHANKDLPDAFDMFLATQQTMLVIRAWVATQLGVPSAELASRFDEIRRGGWNRTGLSPRS